MSQMTLRMGVERVLREDIPEITEVQAVSSRLTKPRCARPPTFTQSDFWAVVDKLASFSATALCLVSISRRRGASRCTRPTICCALALLDSRCPRGLHELDASIGGSRQDRQAPRRFPRR